MKPDFATVGLFTPYEGNVYKGLQNDMADLIEKVDDKTGDKYYHNANIESTWEFPEGYSKQAIQKNFYDEGTSYAAPRVSGIIALLLSSDPTLTYEEIYEALKTTNMPNHETGHGVVNAVEALKNTNYKHQRRQWFLTDKHSLRNWILYLFNLLYSQGDYIERK